MGLDNKEKTKFEIKPIMESSDTIKLQLDKYFVFKIPKSNIMDPLNNSF